MKQQRARASRPPFTAKEPKPTAARRWGLHTHTRILSIMLIHRGNPLSPGFLLINQGGAAALWGRIDLSN